MLLQSFHISRLLFLEQFGQNSYTLARNRENTKSDFSRVQNSGRVCIGTLCPNYERFVISFVLVHIINYAAESRAMVYCNDAVSRVYLPKESIPKTRVKGDEALRVSVLKTSTVQLFLT